MPRLSAGHTVCVPHRKYITAGLVGFLAFLPMFTRAQDVSAVQAQINALLQQVAQLQAQLAPLSGAAAPAALSNMEGTGVLLEALSR